MVSKVTFKLRLDMKGVDDKDELKDEVGNFVLEQILEDASDGRSSVNGRFWKKLSSEYREFKQEDVGSGDPNMELTGDMLDALEFKPYRDGVEIGFFDKKEAQKADNHNKFSAKSQKTKLPKRQAIPKKGEVFRPAIRNEIKQIIKEFKDG